MRRLNWHALVARADAARHATKLEEIKQTIQNTTAAAVTAAASAAAKPAAASTVAAGFAERLEKKLKHAFFDPQRERVD